MRKALVLLIGALMVVMFAAESYAETTVGGTIDVRGRWRENNNDLNNDGATTGAANGSTAFWQQKVNLWVDAKIAEGLKGYVELQSASTSKGWLTWGTARTNTDSAPNSVVNENRGLSLMEIRYAYMDFMIPGTPVGIKIGHMPVVVGHSIWANTSVWGSDGLMIYAVPTKEMMIALGTIKGVETASNTDRSDLDMYGLHFNYTFMPKNTLGAHINYLLKTGDSRNASGDMKLWNFMVTADGALDFGLGYKFEIDLQSGNIYDTEIPGASDLKGSGKALLLGVDYKIADIAKVGMDAAYGSGDDTTTADKHEGYVNFNDYGYTMIYEDIVSQKVASGATGGALGNTDMVTGATTDFGLYNTMYAKLGASVTPMKDMSVGLDLFYLRAVKENYSGQKKDLGIEVDLNFGYNIYKNLKWTFLAGYFMPGSHYDARSASDNIKGDNAWAFEQKLSLKF